jgi:hypothetical protein
VLRPAFAKVAHAEIDERLHGFNGDFLDNGYEHDIGIGPTGTVRGFCNSAPHRGDVLGEAFRRQAHWASRFVGHSPRILETLPPAVPYVRMPFARREMGTAWSLRFGTAGRGGMKAVKIALALLGILAGMLVVWQLVSGVLMVTQESIRLTIRTPHQHVGYLTATLTLIYIAASIAVILNLPTRWEAGPDSSETPRQEEKRKP